MTDPITLKPGEETIVRARSGGNSPSFPYLVLVEGPHRGTRFALEEGENNVGRSPGSHVLLEDQSVSRRHCCFVRRADVVTVSDRGSKNGTRVNGARLKEAVTLGHGDVVRIGIYALRLIAREIPLDEELAPVDKEPMVLEEQPANYSSETDLLEEEKIAKNGAEEIVEDEEALEQDEEKEALEQDEEKKASTPPVGSPAKNKLLIWLLATLVILSGVGLLIYYLWFIPPAAEKVKMVRRHLPAAPKELAPKVDRKPVNVPVFVDFDAQPMPARVVFLGKDYGMTPIKVHATLKVGESYPAEGHFYMPEFKEERVERVTVSVDEKQGLVPVFFRAPIGMLKVERLPKQGQLSLQGFFAYDNFTPHDTTLTDVSYGKPVYVPYGRYVIELRVQQEIAASGQFVPVVRYRREVLLSEDSPTYAIDVSEEDLHRFPVDIRSRPSGAVVMIDHRKVGETPYRGEFPLGDHVLVLRKEGYFEHTQPISNEINVVYKLDVRLKTTEAGEILNEGRALVLKGRFKEAIAMLGKVFEHDPAAVEQAQAQYFLGTSFLGIGDLKAAKGYFEQAQGHPDYAMRAKLGLVRVLSAQKKPLEALPILVDVMLHARDKKVLSEAKAVFSEISPLKSVIYIYTDPPGASVFVNDEPMKTKTPTILHDLGLGNYRIRVEHEDYQPKSVNINLSVSEFNPVIIKMEPVVK